MNRAPATVGASRSGGGDPGPNPRSTMDRTRLHLTLTAGVLTLLSAGLLSFLSRTAGPCDRTTGNTTHPDQVVGWTCPQALLSCAVSDLLEGLSDRISSGAGPEALSTQKYADRPYFGPEDPMASLAGPSGPAR